MKYPQWLLVRRVKLSAERAALSRLHNHLDRLRRRRRHLEETLMDHPAGQKEFAGAMLMAENRYRERQLREHGEVTDRIQLAQDAVQLQVTRLVQARVALEVAEETQAAQANDARRLQERRMEERIQEWRSGR